MAEDTKTPFAHRLPQITILSDHPAQDRKKESGLGEVELIADRDLFTLESRLSTVFDILRHRNTSCPLTVAINGPWGIGKSSAMRWLETRLNEWNHRSRTERTDRQGHVHPRVRTVWFDPWRYHSREDVWRGIIAEVILAAVKPTIRGESPDRLPLIREAAKKFGGFLGRAFLVVLEEWESEISPSFFGISLGSLKFGGKSVAAIRKAYDETTHPEKGYLNEFEDTLRTWIERGTRNEFGGPPDRIAIFIDDLDRCLPAVTLEVFEALKLYLNIPSLVFVAGLDRDMVNCVITAHYEQNKLPAIKASTYLDKFFQVTIPITPSSLQMKDFFRKQIEALDKANDSFWSRHLDASDSDTHGKGTREGKTDNGPIDPNSIRGLVQDALERLSANVPREAKRMLNSAIERGHRAAFNTSLDEKLGIDTKHRGLRFAQGVQVFMLQHWLWLRGLDGGSLLLGEAMLGWFVTASERVRAVFATGTNASVNEEALCTQLRQKESIWLPIPSGTSPLPSPAPTPTATVPPEPIEELARHLLDRPGQGTEKEGDVIARWLSPVLWKILRIPFSQEVVQSAPKLEPITKAIQSLTNLLTAASEPMRQHLARLASVPIDSLTADHLQEIRELDLSYMPLTIADLRLLCGMTQLQSLDLDGTNVTNEWVEILNYSLPNCAITYP